MCITSNIKKYYSPNPKYIDDKESFSSSNLRTFSMTTVSDIVKI